MLCTFSDNIVGQTAVFFHFYFWVIKIKENFLKPDQKYLPLWLYNRLKNKKKSVSHNVKN